MRVSIFGLGYVGCATAVGLAGGGHEVLGVDVSERKVRMLNRGDSPIIGSDFDTWIRSCVRRGKLRGLTDGTMAVGESDISLISVGSPRKRNGQFDYGPLLNAIWTIGEGLKEKRAYHVIGLRSAVPPGTTESLVIPELENISGKSAETDFGVCVNPEFLRRGAPLEDLLKPPFVVVGSNGGEGAAAWQRLYQGAEKMFHTEIRTAETLKYACDALNSLKVGFAGKISKIPCDLGGATRDFIDFLCPRTKHDRSRVDLRRIRAPGSPATLPDPGLALERASNWPFEASLLKMLLECLREQTAKAVDQAASSSVGPSFGDKLSSRAHDKLSRDC